MPACTPAELVNAAACYVCLDRHMQQAIRVRLLCAILNGEIMACTPATLVEAAKCFTCFDVAQLQAVELSLLCQILAGGSGGIGGVSQGVGPPVGAPVGGNGFYWQQSDSSIWAYDAGLATWVHVGPTQ